MKIEIRPATQCLIDDMKGRLRELDDQECQAASNRSADEALQRGLNVSERSWVASEDGKPFACFGVVPMSILGTIGVPWMLGTDEMRSAKRTVIKYSKAFVEEMIIPYDMLVNWVDVRNEVSIRWLKKCGFTIDDPSPYGVNGLPFHRFWLKKELKDV